MSFCNQAILWNFILPHRHRVKTDFGFLCQFNGEKHFRVFLFASLSQILLIYFLSYEKIPSAILLIACIVHRVVHTLMGSGNEREIFYVMLDKSTYLKKLA